MLYSVLNSGGISVISVSQPCVLIYTLILIIDCILYRIHNLVPTLMVSLGHHGVYVSADGVQNAQWQNKLT